MGIGKIKRNSSVSVGFSKVVGKSSIKSKQKVLRKGKKSKLTSHRRVRRTHKEDDTFEIQDVLLDEGRARHGSAYNKEGKTLRKRRARQSFLDKKVLGTPTVLQEQNESSSSVFEGTKVRVNKAETARELTSILVSDKNRKSIFERFKFFFSRLFRTLINVVSSKHDETSLYKVDLEEKKSTKNLEGEDTTKASKERDLTFRRKIEGLSERGLEAALNRNAVISVKLNKFFEEAARKEARKKDTSKMSVLLPVVLKSLYNELIEDLRSNVSDREETEHSLGLSKFSSKYFGEINRALTEGLDTQENINFFADKIFVSISSSRATDRQSLEEDDIIFLKDIFSQMPEEEGGTLARILDRVVVLFHRRTVKNLLGTINEVASHSAFEENTQYVGRLSEKLYSFLLKTFSFTDQERSRELFYNPGTEAFFGVFRGKERIYFSIPQDVIPPVVLQKYNIPLIVEKISKLDDNALGDNINRDEFIDILIGIHRNIQIRRIEALRENVVGLNEQEEGSIIQLEEKKSSGKKRVRFLDTVEKQEFSEKNTEVGEPPLGTEQKKIERDEKVGDPGIPKGLKRRGAMRKRRLNARVFPGNVTSPDDTAIGREKIEKTRSSFSLERRKKIIPISGETEEELHDVFLLNSKRIEKDIISYVQEDKLERMGGFLIDVNRETILLDFPGLTSSSDMQGNSTSLYSLPPSDANKAAENNALFFKKMSEKKQGEHIPDEVFDEIFNKTTQIEELNKSFNTLFENEKFSKYNYSSSEIVKNLSLLLSQWLFSSLNDLHGSMVLKKFLEITSSFRGISFILKPNEEEQTLSIRVLSKGDLFYYSNGLIVANGELLDILSRDGISLIAKGGIKEDINISIPLADLSEGIFDNLSISSPALIDYWFVPESIR